MAGVIREYQRKKFWRGIWVDLNLGAGNAIFLRGAGLWHCFEGPEFLTELFPGKRNHQGGKE